MSTLNVAIAGFGTIGSGVAHVLTQHGEHPDARINLVGVLERDTQGAYVRSMFEQNPELFYENLEQLQDDKEVDVIVETICLLYTSPSPRDQRGSRMPSSA